MKVGLFIICALALTAFAAEFPEDEDVIVLTDDNFDDAIAQYPYILVEFYAPWCGHCKRLAPEYSKAAKVLKGLENPIPLGKVDATEQRSVASRFEIQGYPTLKFFINGNPIEYGGGRTEQEIVDWVKKKTSPATTELTSAEAVEKFIADNQVAVLFCGDNEESAEFQVWKTVTLSYEDLLFSHVFDSELREQFCKTQSAHVTLFKQFDEGRNDFEGDFDAEAVREFINSNQFPVIIPFDQKAAQKIFGENRPTIFFFTDEGPASEAGEQAFRQASEQLRGKILLSISQIRDGIGQRLGDYVGVAESDLPTVRIVNPSQEEVQKFVLQGDITAENIVQFYNDWTSGNLKPVYKSEEIPENDEGPVRTVVGKNFAQVVLDETKDVLVEFYAPWCGHCKSLAPIYDSLAKRLSHNKNLIIAKVDATANEIEGVAVHGFPTLKFWPANNKQNPIDYDGERTEEGFIKFLQEKATAGFSAEPTGDSEQGEQKEDL